MDEKELDLDMELLGFGASILFIKYTAKEVGYDHETEPHFDFFVDNVERMNEGGEFDDITQFVATTDMDIIKNECEEDYYQCISDLQYGDY